MTEQEIKTRIDKKEKEIQKIEKRIQKWTTGMNEEAKQIVAACELVYEDPQYKPAYQTYKQYKEKHEQDPTVFRQDYEWNKGPQFDEAYSAYRDLAESKRTLEKYRNQLDKLNNFNNMENIPAIWNFLQEWRKQAYEYFVENIKLYAKLKAEQEDKWTEYKETDEYKTRLTMYSGRSGEYYIKSKWLQEYYSPIHRITEDVYKYNGKWDDVKLNKILDKDVQNKYNDFVNRITEKAGTIVDASNLKIAGNGIINGFVQGDKNKVRVETIVAGGYNTDVIVNVKHGQILHYRVLVNIIN